MNRQRLVVGTLGAFGFMSAIAAIGYGCSSKGSDPATATDPDTGVIDRVDSSTPPGDPVDSSVADSAAAQVFKAYATITSTTLAGAVAAGQATFTEQNGEVTVVVDMTAADPVSTMHGMHIHQGGSCGDNDSGVGGAIVNAGAAGPHWNPTDAGHGYPTAAVHHAGDMGNISIGADGKGKLTLLSKEWTVQPGPKSVVGHALIFHIRQDDGMSQPVGDAGTRPGCAVIGTTAPPPPTPCLDDTLVGAAPACPGAGGCATQCTKINANFKKGVAADAVKNLTAAICTANTADTTTGASVAKACTDATAKAFCDALVTGGCSAGLFPSFPTQCLTLTNGLSGTGTGAAATLGRKALYDCINNIGNGLDCTTCQDFVKGKN
jgi:Cu-Zn family superoxide dismutase